MTTFADNYKNESTPAKLQNSMFTANDQISTQFYNVLKEKKHDAKLKINLKNKCFSSFSSFSSPVNHL